MSTKAGVGMSYHHNPNVAGREAAEQALEKAGGQQTGLRRHVRLYRIRPALLGAGCSRDYGRRTLKRLFGGGHDKWRRRR